MTVRIYIFMYETFDFVIVVLAKRKEAGIACGIKKMYMYVFLPLAVWVSRSEFKLLSDWSWGYIVICRWIFWMNSLRWTASWLLGRVLLLRSIIGFSAWTVWSHNLKFKRSESDSKAFTSSWCIVNISFFFLLFGTIDFSSIELRHSL